MTNKNGTKRALLTSLLALLLCCSMLVGSTFAWFTDSAVSGSNVIQSGTLDVEMYWANGTEDPASATWTDASKGPIFNYKLWEPGYVEVRHINIKNVGTLALSYKLNILANGTVSKLADVIDVYYVDPAVQVADRTALTDAYKLGTLTEVLATLGSASSTAAGNLLAGEEHTVTLALKMQESADNQYQNLSIGTDFSVQLLATQYTHETDSFDDQYDADVEPDDAILVHGGVLNLEADEPDELNIAEDAEVTVNLNDNTLQNTLTNNGTVTVNGGTIETDGRGMENTGTATVTDVEMNAGNPSEYAGVTIGDTAVTTYDNFDLVSAGGGIGAVDGAKVVFNSGSVYIDSTGTSGRYNFYTEGAGSEITINGGTFGFSPTKNQKRAYVCATAGTTVYINGGTFGPASSRSGYTAGILGEGTVIIKGGTFGFDPSAWVATGYQAVKSGSTWTVSAI